MDVSPPLPSPRAARLAAGALVWALAFGLMVLGDGLALQPGDLALLPVLAAALAALWWPAPLGLPVCLAAAAWFDWHIVPPRGTLHVEQPRDLLLLLVMTGVSVLVAALVAALRRRAAEATLQSRRAAQLRDWGETLRDSPDPLTQAGALQQALQDAAGRPVALALLREGLPARNDDAALLRLGETDAEQRAGLWHALRQRQALGPGTGRHTEQPDLYLPLRSRTQAHGAALLAGPPRGLADPGAAASALREHLQALCDLTGVALERAQMQREAEAARAAAQAQGVRAALLAAISHDHRTPLATIVGAASALLEQEGRLDAPQRRALAQRIVDEAGHLARLTDNTLQLARLDAPGGVTLRCDWESAEELVGVVLRHARRTPAGARLRARLEPGLPLLWCDATLITQMLDNLVDNALHHSPADAPVELLVRRLPEAVLLAVRDRGPGIAPAWRERVFEVFQRGAEPMPGGPDDAAPRQRPGAGVGLAVCRAIARAHGTELSLRARGHGGCAFECRLPLREAPAVPQEEAA